MNLLIDFPWRNATWAALAGAFIPVMAMLNGRLGRHLGEPIHAVWVLFAVGLLAASAACLFLTGRLPNPISLVDSPVFNLAGGLIVAFYVLSVTLLAPRFGISNTILCIMVAQIVVSASIDQFGWLGALPRPISALKALGLLLLLLGLALTQLAPASSATKSL